MKKKVILLCSLIAIVVVAGVVIMQLTQRAVIKQDTLSERSKDYVDSHKQNTDWKYLQLKEGEDKAGSFVGKRIKIGGCFSFVMVFRVRNAREDGSCQYYFGTEEPRGSVVVYMKPAENIASSSEVDGVSMRRLYKDKYQENKQMINGVEYLIFTNTASQTYEASAFALHSGSAFVFSIVSQNNETRQKELLAMLMSVEFTK